MLQTKLVKQESGILTNLRVLQKKRIEIPSSFSQTRKEVEG